jgi:hypothetical protein
MLKGYAAYRLAAWGRGAVSTAAREQGVTTRWQLLLSWLDLRGNGRAVASWVEIQLERRPYRGHTFVLDGPQEVEPLLAVLGTSAHEVHGGEVGSTKLDVLWVVVVQGGKTRGA